LKEKKILSTSNLIKMILTHSVCSVDELTQEFYELASKILNMMKMGSEC